MEPDRETTAPIATRRSANRGEHWGSEPLSLTGGWDSHRRCLRGRVQDWFRDVHELVLTNDATVNGMQCRNCQG